MVFVKLGNMAHERIPFAKALLPVQTTTVYHPLQLLSRASTVLHTSDTPYKMLASGCTWNENSSMGWRFVP